MKLVRDYQGNFYSSRLWSVSLGLGVTECMFGAKFVQVAMGRCMENCVVLKRYDSTALNSNQGKI